MDDHPDFGLYCAFRYDREKPCDFEVGMGPMDAAVKRWHKDHPPGWERARILVISLNPEESDAVREAAGGDKNMHAWAYEAILVKTGKYRPLDKS
jgi:hypothetical protein